ncbi:hypothetical protein [Eubacterium ramulus]|uniref:hypothetical protein n=1 Tax=Eubacterium ramulus TaxID=39490 RepID=UPI003991B681
MRIRLIPEKKLTPVVKVTDKDDETKVLEEGKDYFIRYEVPAERAQEMVFQRLVLMT